MKKNSSSKKQSTEDLLLELQTSKIYAIESFARTLLSLQVADDVSFHCSSKNYDIVVSAKILCH